jgi:predicted metal-dependent hydrolase
MSIACFMLNNHLMSNNAEQPAIPRLAPTKPLPDYAFVPGRFPHPVSDPQGHSYNRAHEAIVPPQPQEWLDCTAYLYGIDLFNQGYYWEAHETWEDIWHACGRTGEMADFMKGLIQLAVAGVKVREGIPKGVRRHAERAAELFEQIISRLAGKSLRYMGLDLNELIAFSREIPVNAYAIKADPTQRVEVVFSKVLQPR